MALLVEDQYAILRVKITQQLGQLPTRLRDCLDVDDLVHDAMVQILERGADKGVSLGLTAKRVVFDRARYLLRGVRDARMERSFDATLEDAYTYTLHDVVPAPAGVLTIDDEHKALLLRAEGWPFHRIGAALGVSEDVARRYVRSLETSRGASLEDRKLAFRRRPTALHRMLVDAVRADPALGVADLVRQFGCSRNAARWARVDASSGELKGHQTAPGARYCSRGHDLFAPGAIRRDVDGRSGRQHRRCVVCIRLRQRVQRRLKMRVVKKTRATDNTCLRGHPRAGNLTTSPSGNVQCKACRRYLYQKAKTRGVSGACGGTGGDVGGHGAAPRGVSCTAQGG